MPSDDKGVELQVLTTLVTARPLQYKYKIANMANMIMNMSNSNISFVMSEREIERDREREMRREQEHFDALSVVVIVYRTIIIFETQNRLVSLMNCGTA